MPLTYILKCSLKNCHPPITMLILYGFVKLGFAMLLKCYLVKIKNALVVQVSNIEQ